VSAFLAIAGDVPRRVRRGWLMWLFFVAIIVLLALVALPLGKAQDVDGTIYATWWGNDMRGDRANPMSLDVAVNGFVGGIFGLFLASYVGVFAGLVLLADAVSSAFAPGQAELNLPKPIPRATIVVARHVGAMAVATFFATLVVGGAFGIAYLRTGVVATKALVCIPVSVAIFGVLHAVGSIVGGLTLHPLLAAFAAVGTWLISIATNVPSWWPEFFDAIGKNNALFGLVIRGVKLTHRILPRAVDLPSLAERVISHKFAEEPLGMSGEVELIGNALVWWGLALALAVLVVRRRDF
jgi:hypothetical protein